MEREVRALLARGETLGAIRRVRAATGARLKEAKERVEQLARQPTEQAVAAPPGTAAGGLERLAELQRIREAGLISAREFEARRAEILQEL